MEEIIQKSKTSDFFQKMSMGEMKICIQKLEENIPSGKVFSCYAEEPLEFHGIADMILKIDELCDSLNFRMSNRIRKGMAQEQGAVVYQNAQCRHLFKDFTEVHGSVCIFYLRLRYRENVSWQGSIRFLGSQRLYHFRSVLELMGYLDEKIGLRTGIQEVIHENEG